MTVSRSPVDVQAALEAAGLGIRVHVLENPTATAQQAADAIGTTLGSIVKSLCFLVDGTPVLVLAPGDRSVDARRLARRYGVNRKKVRLASAEATMAATGYAPGGVPPVGLVRPLPVLVDASLGRFETVYAAAGSSHAIFPIAYARLVEITGGEVLDLALD